MCIVNKQRDRFLPLPDQVAQSPLTILDLSRDLEVLLGSPMHAALRGTLFDSGRVKPLGLEQWFNPGETLTSDCPKCFGDRSEIEPTAARTLSLCIWGKVAACVCVHGLSGYQGRKLRVCTMPQFVARSLTVCRDRTE